MQVQFQEEVTLPYDIEDTPEGYNKAKAELKNPLEASEENLENGKAMYTNLLCNIVMVKKVMEMVFYLKEKNLKEFLSYKDRDINEGSIYHVVMHGKNLMGSHASQLTYKERWQIVQYVESLRSDLAKIITKRKNTKDMYQFSGKLKMASIVLIIIGALGIGYGFLTAPSSTLEDAKEIMAHQASHGDSHGELQIMINKVDDHHKEEVKHVAKEGEHKADSS